MRYFQRLLPALTTLLAALAAACLADGSDDAPPTMDRALTSSPAARGDGVITLTLTQGTNLAAVANRRDGSIVLALQGALYRQAPGETAARPLLLQHDAWEPDIAPDGKSLLYQGYLNGNWDIWRLPLLPVRTGMPAPEPRPLTRGEFDDREPVFSGDGRYFMFASDRSGNYDLWRAELDVDAGDTDSPDREPVQFTDSPDNDYAPAWSARTDEIAWVRDGASDGDGPYVIVAKSPDDARERILHESKAPLSGLQWTPDGQGLTFRTLDRDRTTGNALTALRLLSLATGTVAKLTPDDADVFPFRASWLDDTRLLFTMNGEIRSLDVEQQDGSGTWVTNPDSLSALPFVVERDYTPRPYAPKVRNFDETGAKQALGISQPALSPDGERVAFSALGDLWLWHPQTATLEQLTDDPAADQMPFWSADGKSLVYVSDKGGAYHVWRRVLAEDAPVILPVTAKELSFPRLSPDGRSLAYFTDVPGNPLLHVEGQLTVTRLDTGEIRQLLAPMPPQPINWSGDGRYLLTTRLAPYSSRYREGLFGVVSVDVTTGEAIDQTPTPHHSITNAALATGSNALVFSEDGLLKHWQLDAAMRGRGGSGILVESLADNPVVSADGTVIVYQAGDRLMRLHRATNASSDITPPLTWQADISGDVWLLRAGRVFTGREEQYLEDQDILIRGNRIAAIGPIGSLAADEAPNAGLPVVDASDRVVVPGLFESHAHIGDHNHSETQGRVWLSYGVTSVRDPGSNPYLANERREAWDSGRRIGPRLFITGHNIDGNRVYYAVAEGIGSDAHLERALQRSELLQVDLLKSYVRLPDRQQRRVVEFAHAMGVPVTSHELMPAAVNGVDQIEHFTGTSRRGYGTKISELGRSYQDVAEVLTGTGMGVVPTMVVPGVVLTFDEQDDIYTTPQFNHFYGRNSRENYQAFMGFFGPGSEGFVDNYGSLLSTLVHNDVLVATGTDSPFTPFGTGLHAEFRLYQREGLMPWQILRAATLDSARLVGVDQDLGSIEVGKLADLVIIDGDPLSDIRDLDNVEMTIKGGRSFPLSTLFATPD